jgi:hypothetical protein
VHKFFTNAGATSTFKAPVAYWGPSKASTYKVYSPGRPGARNFCTSALIPEYTVGKGALWRLFRTGLSLLQFVHWATEEFPLITCSLGVMVCLFVCFHGRPRQATDVLQPTGLLYRPLWTFHLWPPDAPTPTDAFRTPAAEVGTYGRGIGSVILPKCRLPRYI